MAELTQDEIIGYLNTLPASDVDFKNALKQADEDTVRMILADTADLPANKKIKAALEARLQQILTVAVGTNNLHTGILKMDQDTYNAGREEEEQRQVQQTAREGMIAQTHEMIGRIQGFKAISEFADVGRLVWLKQVKDSKIYRDLPNVGTWEKFCNYIGLSRQKVDEDISNLNSFGEQFLTTVGSFSIGYRELRQLRQLTHDGAVTIDGDCLTIENETIPIDQDHAEELQAAIERIITASNETKTRVEKLEKQFKAAVDEETKGLKLEKKTLLKEVERLKVFDPEDVDDSRFEGQYELIHETVNTLATQIAKLVMMEGLHENPLAAAKVEGFIASGERLVEDLRRDWTAKFQIF